MKIVCQNLDFRFADKSIIRNLNLEIQAGEHLLIKGPSGSGKSSFLRIISGLLKSQSGKIFYKDLEFSALANDQVSSFRQKYIGYLHQECHLIDHWTVGQNLSLVDSDLERQERMLHKLDLQRLIPGQRVLELSGGEKQRVALSRLLLATPAIGLLDEPTSHLDDQAAELVMNLLKEVFKDKTLIVVSHDQRWSNGNFRELHFAEINGVAR